MTTNTTNNINTMSFDNFLIENKTASSRAKNDKFITFSSKKSFDEYVNNGIEQINDKQREYIEKFKTISNVFTFSFSVDYNFVAITLYYHNNKSYRYIAIDFENNQVHEFDSIKTTKQYILDCLVANDLKKLNLATDEKSVETVETTETTETVEKPKKVTKKSK